ncbi:MAG: hypothetical protein WC307_04930 [Candidatus Nanoarchaeia archaeon]|jgi:hypothetical protein
MNKKNDELMIVLNDKLTVMDKEHSKELTKMVNYVNENLPAMSKTAKNFYKTQSQFMDNTLTLHHPTSIRNVRQDLAQVQKTMMAINEYGFDVTEKEIKIDRLKYEIAMNLNLETNKPLNEFDKRLKENEINKLRSQILTSNDYKNGAIKTLTNYVANYLSIMEKVRNELGKPDDYELTEEDFENEEEKYHIKTAFEQALCAARSHGGAIDEGNQIYLTQIGINGTLAQQCVTGYLMMEQKMIKEVVDKVEGARLPNHADQLKFLEDMYQKFKDCSKEYSTKKGINIKTSIALFGGEKDESD